MVSRQSSFLTRVFKGRFFEFREFRPRVAIGFGLGKFCIPIDLGQIGFIRGVKSGARLNQRRYQPWRTETPIP